MVNLRAPGSQPGSGRGSSGHPSGVTFDVSPERATGEVPGRTRLYPQLWWQLGMGQLMGTGSWKSLRVTWAQIEPGLQVEPVPHPHTPYIPTPHPSHPPTPPLPSLLLTVLSVPLQVHSNHRGITRSLTCQNSAVCRGPRAEAWECPKHPKVAAARSLFSMSVPPGRVSDGPSACSYLPWALVAGGGPCKQQCRDTGDEVICSCFVGYQLQSDGVSCEGNI